MYSGEGYGLSSFYEWYYFVCLLLYNKLSDLKQQLYFARDFMNQELGKGLSWAVWYQLGGLQLGYLLPTETKVTPMFLSKLFSVLGWASECLVKMLRSILFSLKGLQSRPLRFREVFSSSREGLRGTSLIILWFPLGKHTYLTEVSIRNFKVLSLRALPCDHALLINPGLDIFPEPREFCQ